MRQSKRATEVNPPGTSGIAVKNGSNVPVNSTIRGGNANSNPAGTTWTLANTIGINQYVPQFAINITTPTWLNLTTNNQSLFSNLGINQTRYFDLKITLPTETPTNLQMNVPIIITTTQAD